MSPNILTYSKESNLTLSTVNLDLVLKETSFFYAMTTPIIAFFLSETFIKTILAHAALLQCLAYVAKKLIKKPATCAGFFISFFT